MSTAVRSRTASAWRLLATGCLAMLLMGCASTKKRFETGMDLEAKGDYVAAANSYIDVLQREPGWPHASERLSHTGKLAIAQLMTDGRTAESVGDPARAVRLYTTADDLQKRAGGVGVPLALPSDFTATRDRAIDLAIRKHVDLARTATNMREWPAALEQLDLAQSYPMAGSRFADIQQKRGRVHLSWAEDEFDRHHYRAAYEQSHIASDLLRNDVEARDRARQIEIASIQRGTRGVVLLPFTETQTVALEAPPGFTQELNDVLLFDEWREPPLFLSVVDPNETRRVMHEMGLSREGVTDREAVDVARALGAAFAVLGDVESFTWRSEVKSEKRVKARTKGRSAVDTTYVEQTVEVHLIARVAVTTVDAASGRSMEQKRHTKRVFEKIKQGVYNGNPDELDLTRRERSLFDRKQIEETEWALTKRLIASIADGVASPVQVTLLDRIP